MGWRLRKSINLGFGFRINLSKSGIGYSWGFPGYRTTKLANGGTRQTYSIPGTGVSYVEQQGGRKNNNSEYHEESKLITGDTELFQNVPIEDIRKNDPILKEINRVVSVNRLANLSLFLTLFVLVNPAFSLAFFAGITLKILITTTMKIKLYYEFDDESRKMYNSLKEIWITLSQNRKLWQINSSTRVFNTKYNAGAGNNVDRNNAFVMSKLPSFIKANIDIYGLNLRNQKMYFTPDRILVFKPFRKVFGCTYRDMFLGISSQRFVESERLYKDTEVVDYAWRYTNKDGSRDLRFNNNRKYPVCRYGELTIKSPNGIHTVIEFSNHELAYDIQNKLVLFGNQFNKILELTKKDEALKDENEAKSFEVVEKKKIDNIDSIIDDTDFDPIYKDVLEFVISSGKVSASLLQRRFKLGYNRACRIIDHMEEQGIVGPQNGSKPRDVLVKVSEEDGE